MSRENETKIAKIIHSAFLTTQVVDLLMAKWVAIFVKTILISREIPAGQLDNARENIDAP